MRKNKIIIAIGIVLIVCLLFWYKKTNLKEEEIDLTSQITTIQIIDNDNQLEKLNENPEAEEFVIVDLKINDKFYSDVGIRTKGNSLYNWLKQNNSTRYSYKIKLDYINRNQQFNGMKEISLNSHVMDKTEIREYLVYEVYNKMGIQTQQYGLGALSINDTYIGLITLVEVINVDYIREKYNSIEGNLYKPVQDLRQNYLGADLRYRGEKLEAYGSFFNTIKTSNTTLEDKKRLIEIIEKLNNSNSEEIENLFIDFDKVIKTIAINKAVANLDGVTGKIIRNYYLYEENGKLDILSFDFNISLGMYPFVWKKSDTETIGFFEIEENYFSKLIDIIILNDEYYQKYKEYVNETIGILKKIREEKIIERIDYQVDSIIKYGTNKIYTHEEYKKEIEELKLFLDNRIERQESGRLFEEDAKVLYNFKNEKSIFFNTKI